MINNYIVAPVLVHLVLAILTLSLWRKVVAQKLVSVFGSLGVLVLAFRLFQRVRTEGILTMNAAGWDAPFGIVFVADLLSSSLVLLTAFAGLAVAVFSVVGIGRARILYGYFPILHFLLMGVNGAFLTGDIFNLYVFFEVIIISSFVLMTLGGRKPQLEGGVKYMSMNILASMIFLTGIGILYGITGCLNLADLARTIPEVKNQNLVDITAVFFLIGFGIKSAVFPLYFWLPSSYHTPPSAVAAVFGGLLTKVGVYALLRVFSLVFVPDAFIQSLILTLAALTIVTGALGALIKYNIRRMFSYLIVCHIGFMMAGLGMFTEVALAGAVLYLFHDLMAKTNLFLVAGLIRQLRGTMNMNLLGGIYEQYPRISLLIAIVLFSVIGIPPLSGFWPKILLFEGGFTGGYFLTIGVIIFGSLITLWVLAKLWAKVFWKSSPEDSANLVDEFAQKENWRKWALVTPVVLLAAVSLFIGLGAEFMIGLSKGVASELMDPSPYVEAVLQDR